MGEQQGSQRELSLHPILFCPILSDFKVAFFANPAILKSSGNKVHSSNSRQITSHVARDRSRAID